MGCRSGPVHCQGNVRFRLGGRGGVVGAGSLGMIQNCMDAHSLRYRVEGVWGFRSLYL